MSPLETRTRFRCPHPLVKHTEDVTAEWKLRTPAGRHVHYSCDDTSVNKVTSQLAVHGRSPPPPPPPPPLPGLLTGQHIQQQQQIFGGGKHFHTYSTCLLSEPTHQDGSYRGGAEEGGGETMIDLSYLTEEEQGMIMTVLMRDIELQKAEEERIRKLESVPHSGPQFQTELKSRTGEWFYEAKSRRHMDEIHGSVVILASMKQRSASLDSSLRNERAKKSSSRGSDIAIPPKPARYSEALQPQEIKTHIPTEEPPSTEQSDFRRLPHIRGLFCRLQAGAKE
ncbi:Synaptotagmin-like protein 2 [Liparis tanakae]|uniref:Synaptotagmin-like protein 2 n=1 Tax=Liparis tanakae TaxID=230148 RepID=A0A4Z2H1V6_9TELE|nr:Synaptotagmin-like protein 2 [Liparis tanakae]